MKVSTQELDKAVSGGLAMAIETGETKPKVLLSMNQLVLRRGLTLLTAVLILIIGVTVHIACPLPEPYLQTQSNLTMDWSNFSTPNTTVQ